MLETRERQLFSIVKQKRNTTSSKGLIEFWVLQTTLVRKARGILPIFLCTEDVKHPLLPSFLSCVLEVYVNDDSWIQPQNILGLREPNCISGYISVCIIVHIKTHFKGIFMLHLMTGICSLSSQEADTRGS